MGMFDTVVIEGLKLKVPEEVKTFLGENDRSLPEDFQTKDLDNTLTTYYIKKDGQVYETDYRPTGKKIKTSFPKALESWKSHRSFLERYYLDRTGAKITPRIVEERRAVRVKAKFTQVILIYTYVAINDRYLELEYELNIVNGKVKKSKIVKWEIESEKLAIERRERDQKWNDEQTQKQIKRERLQQQWYYPILKEVYNPIVFFGSKAIVKVCNKLIQLTYRWNRV